MLLEYYTKEYSYWKIFEYICITNLTLGFRFDVRCYILYLWYNRNLWHSWRNKGNVIFICILICVWMISASSLLDPALNLKSLQMINFSRTQANPSPSPHSCKVGFSNFFCSESFLLWHSSQLFMRIGQTRKKILNIQNESKQQQWSASCEKVSLTH